MAIFRRLFLFAIASCLPVIFALPGQAQTVNAAYRKALYQKYPTQKTDFCASCKLWVNPYYRAIADTMLHMPLVTFYVYTRAHRLEQELSGPDREGPFSVWNAAYGQPNETRAYEAINDEIAQPNTRFTTNKGHCQAWILLAYTGDAAIFSNTYTFNSAVEYQGQNLGTEIASEDTCRALTGWKRKVPITDSVSIWCGTYGVQKIYNKNGLTMAVPKVYYKLIRYRELLTGKVITYGWWMPNQPDENGAKLASRRKTYPELVQLLGYDPRKVFSQ